MADPICISIRGGLTGGRGLSLGYGEERRMAERKSRTPAEWVAYYRTVIVNRYGPDASRNEALNTVPRRYHHMGSMWQMITAFTGKGGVLVGFGVPAVPGESGLVVAPEVSMELGTPAPLTKAEVQETFQEVTGGVYDGGLDTVPEEPTGLTISSEVQRVVNVDIAPIRFNAVHAGDSINAYGAWLYFGGTSKRVDILAETNPLDVQLWSASGYAMTVFYVPAGDWIPLDVESTRVRVKSHTADAAAAYQVIAWL